MIRTLYAHTAPPVSQVLPIASREWIWTRITRCVDFKKVRLYKNEEFDKQMTKNDHEIFSKQAGDLQITGHESRAGLLYGRSMKKNP